jgi:hypothetical protein
MASSGQNAPADPLDPTWGRRVTVSAIKTAAVLAALCAFCALPRSDCSNLAEVLSTGGIAALKGAAVGAALGGFIESLRRPSPPDD